MTHILVVDGIALVVAVAPIALRPVILRMNESLIVQGLVEVQNRRQDIILHFNQLEGFVGSLFRLCRNNRHFISDKPHVLVENISIIR